MAEGEPGKISLNTALAEIGRRKFGRDISITTFGWQTLELEELAKKVELRPLEFRDAAVRRDSRVLIDVSVKEHVNRGSEEDTFEITTEALGVKTDRSGYSLCVVKGLDIGGRALVGANIFNLGTAGVALSEKQANSKARSSEIKCNASLSKKYGILEKIGVQPGCKATVTIKTYLQTYEGDVVMEVSAPANHGIRVRYTQECCSCAHEDLACCSSLFQVFSREALCSVQGYITAYELFHFADPDSFREEDGVVYYRAVYHYSYLSDVTEIHKVEEKL